jgi:hypothetical protein
MATLMISGNIALAARSQVERMTGIEPALSAWEADVLPLNYIRRFARHRRVADLSLPTHRTGTGSLLAALLRSCHHGLIALSGGVARLAVAHEGSALQGSRGTVPRSYPDYGSRRQEIEAPGLYLGDEGLPSA